MNDLATQRKQALINKLLDMGYEPDPRGHLTCIGTQLNAHGERVRRRYRVKFQDISVRVEVQGTQRHPVFNTLPWLRVTSCYYTKIHECDDGRLRVGSLLVGSKNSIAVVA